MLAIGVSLLNLVRLRIQGALRLRAVSLFAWSVEKITRNTQMTRHDKRESLFFLLGLPPSFLASLGFAARRSLARVLPFLNLKKKRGCSQSKALLEYSLTGLNQNLKRKKKTMGKSVSVENDKRDSCLVDPANFLLSLGNYGSETNELMRLWHYFQRVKMTRFQSCS